MGEEKAASGATPQTAARLRRIRADYATNAGRSRREAERYAERGSADWARWSEQEADGFEADAAALLAGENAIEILKQILQDLPTKRDWLDPVLEARAKAVIHA